MSVDQYNIDPDALYVARVPIPQKRFEMGGGWTEYKVDAHMLVRLESVNEGAMFQYIDPASGRCVGSVGCNKVSEFVRDVQDFLPANKTGPRGDLTNPVQDGTVHDISESKEVPSVPNLTLYIELSPDADIDAARALLARAGAETLMKGATAIELSQSEPAPPREQPTLGLSRRVAVSPFNIKQALQEAIAAGIPALTLDYIDAHGRETTRAIRPLSLGERWASEYLAAEDIDKGERRHFRLDRIERVEW